MLDGGKAHHRNSKSNLAHSLNTCSLNTCYIPARVLRVRHTVVNMSARALPTAPHCSAASSSYQQTKFSKTGPRLAGPWHRLNLENKDRALVFLCIYFSKERVHSFYLFPRFFTLKVNNQR